MKTMAEVLAAHYIGPLNEGGYYCFNCGDLKDFKEAAAHQAAALSAAGFGPVREAQAQALNHAATIFHARLPDGTGNGRAYNSYQVADMLRARAATLEAS